MDDSQFGTFDRAFRRVAVAFRVRVPASDREELTRTYFRALASHPLDRVLEGGKRCLETLTTFPKVNEWLHAIAPAGQAAAPPPDVRWMRETEIAEHARAKAQRYEDDPCACTACVAAGVSDRRLRFVPTDDARAFHPHRGVVPVGHWAHGEELARWYAAHAVFFGLAQRKYPAIARQLAAVLCEREPGEEG